MSQAAAEHAARSPYRSYWIGEHGRRLAPRALIRDPRSSMQVWSRHGGYPGDGPGRFVLRREIDLPRPRDLEITYTSAFTDIVHELRGHIGAMRTPVAQPSAVVAP